jgi:hypothetical protein
LSATGSLPAIPFFQTARAHLRNVPHVLDSYGGTTVVTQEIQRARH